MRMSLKKSKWQVVIFIGTILAILVLNIRPAQVSAEPLANYPTDPTSDITWTPQNYVTVSDIQNAFNYARTTENTQLGKSIPMLILPSQATWNAMSDGSKAFWLSNRERIDRGVMPMDSIETNVTSIAQYYANYLLVNNKFDHYADGNSPWQRLNTNPAINACHDFLSVAENLAVFATSRNSIPLPIEQSVYEWMYNDAGSGWGHRHAILWYPYNDNSGTVGKEGFMGIGRAHGGPYQGSFPESWNYVEIIVMNVFDPCTTWQYPSTKIYMPLVIR